jgi:hypothetical protein
MTDNFILYQKIQLQTFRGFDKLKIAIQIQFVGAKQKQLIKITKVADNLVLALVVKNY